jgi:hypothetical protein
VGEEELEVDLYMEPVDDGDRAFSAVLKADDLLDPPTELLEWADVPRV